MHLNTLDSVIRERNALMSEAAALAQQIHAASGRLLKLTLRNNRLTRAIVRLTPGHLASDPFSVIKFAVADHFGQTIQGLESDDRHSMIVWPRHVAMYLCRRLLTGASLETIGDAFHRDHGAVLHACRAVQNRLDSEPLRREDITLLISKIEPKLKPSVPHRHAGICEGGSCSNPCPSVSIRG